ncbi:MAG TPA: DUF996 domain-containing protein [Verrucomicrobiae bacterium]|nr:DUF996 domain-containing protein [Verrucomicrobiae bacterium]
MSSGSLESSKTMSGIGSILLIFPIISIVGIILVLLGMKGMSDYYKEPSIYQNALWGVIFGIIALIAIAVAVPLFFVFGGFSVLTLGLSLLGLFGLAVVVFVFYLIAAMYFRRAFNALAQKSGEHLFETAGLLLFIGAVLTIVFFIGLLLILIGWILATVAFFSIKVPSQPYAYAPPPPPTAPVSTTAPPIQATQATRYCPNCGAPVAPNTAFCPHCGKQLPPV